MEDLFGNRYDVPIKTFEREYQEYIRSPKWRRKRLAALERATNKCQKCGISKWSKSLEVHHLTYQHFKNELPEDLIVLCGDCHQSADQERKQQGEYKRYQRWQDARLNGWASRVYGEDWEDWADAELVSEQFNEWLENFYG